MRAKPRGGCRARRGLAGGRRAMHVDGMGGRRVLAGWGGGLAGGGGGAWGGIGGARLEVLQGFLVVLRDAEAVHVHVAQPVLRGRVRLGRALAEVLERRRVARLHPRALRVHVAQVRVRRGVARGRRQLVEAVGPLRVHRQPARAVQAEVAQGELRVDAALMRRVLVVLDHVVIRTAALGATPRAVDAEPHLHRGEGVRG